MSDEMTTSATNSESAEPEVNLEAVDREVANEEDASTNPEQGVDGENEDSKSSDDASDTHEDVEYEDVEYEGKKYKLPKEIKDAVMRHADYTQKTQEIAEARRTVESVRAAIQQQAQLHQATMAEQGRLAAITQRLEDYDKVDWAAWQASDPVAAQREWMTRTQLKEAQDGLVRGIQEKQYQIALNQQQELARQIEQGQAVIAREIPGWGPEKAKELRDVGKSIGFSEAELSQVYRPELVKLLHLASIGQKAISQAKSTASKKPAEPVQPAQTVSRSAPATKSPDRMSTDEWMRQRNKQVRGS